MTKADREDILKHIDAKIGVLAELFDDKVATVIENVEVIVERNVRTIVQEELVEVKTSIKTIEAVVKDTNRDLKTLQNKVADHEERITTLEAA